MNERTPNSVQRDDIQALRAVAVLGVILFHMHKDYFPGGFVGVDIFFVISGYLIGKIIWTQREQGSFRWGAFYMSRIQRIVPAYMVMLIAVALLMGVLLEPDDLQTFLDSFKSSFFFVSNTHFAGGGDYFGPDEFEWPLLHTWSLAVEMQFYLLLPALLLFTPRRWVKPVLLLLTSGLLLHSIWRLAQGDQQAVYFSLLARIPEFLIGTLVALYAVGQTWSSRMANGAGVIGLLLIAASFAFIHSNLPFPGWLALPPCLGAALLIAAGQTQSGVSRWLSRPWLVSIGALSYSLYLWHWPILAAIRYVSGAYEPPLIAVIPFLVLIFTLPYASYHWVEQPFRHNRGAFSRWALASLIGVTVLCYPIVKPMNDAAGPGVTLTEMPAEISGKKPENVCLGRIVGDCLFGDKSSEHRVLLIGDSHASHLAGFADVVGNELGIAIEIIAAPACIPIEGINLNRLAERRRPGCQRQILEVGKRLPNAETIILSVSWVGRLGTDSGGSDTRKALENFLHQTQIQGKKVIVMADTPRFLMQPLGVIRLKRIGLEVIPVQGQGWRAKNAEVGALAAEYPHTEFVDLTSSPVFATAPFLDGWPMYSDRNHLNHYGSRKYGEAAVERMAQALGLERHEHPKN